MLKDLFKLVSKIKENGELDEADIKEFQENFDKDKFQKFIETELPEFQKAEEEARKKMEQKESETKDESQEDEPEDEPQDSED